MEPLPAIRFLDRTTPPHIVTLVLLAGLSALSMNVFLPSLPAMTAWFQTDYALMQLSISAYLGVVGLLQIIIGPLSDRYGRRPVILAALAVFLLATIGCLLAPNVTVFLTFRMIQAAVATGMVLSRAIVRDMVPVDAAASMIGYVTMGMSLVPMIAPAIGGLLDELFGWQAVFGILLVLGLAVLAVAWGDLGETNRHRAASMTEQMRHYPTLFASRRFWGYCLSAAFASGSFFAFLGGAPFVAETVFGLSPSQLGIYFGFVSLGYMIGNFLSGRCSVRVGINRMILLGTLVTLAGLAVLVLLVIGGLATAGSFFGLMLTVGLGNGMVLPNANAGMVSVRPHLAGSASGLGGAIMLGGGATLAALTGHMLTPASGAMPLLWVMLASTLAGLVTIAWVMAVARRAAPLGEEADF